MRQKWNLNDRIHFELTEEGKEKWAQRALEEQQRWGYPAKHIHRVPIGPTTMQLWEFMSFFGDVFRLGTPAYIIESSFELETS